MPSLNFSANSVVGRIRKNNQDSGYASPNLLAVADGMGGAAGGDVASTVAVQELAKIDSRMPAEETLEALAEALRHANERLLSLVMAEPDLDGMGTTVCAVLFTGDQVGLAHIGDSRAYLLRDDRLIRLTHDHSWVQGLIDEGRLTPEQAETHPHRSLLLKVLNGQPIHEPDFELIDVELGDRLMFCSDGLCGLVHDDEIKELLAAEDPEAAVTSLVEAANEAGGVDNITVVVADVVETDEELDVREPVTVGAAADPHLPEITTTMAAVSDEAGEVMDEEVVRYAPRHRRFKWVGSLAIAVLALAVLAGGVWATLAYTRTKFFVGAEDAQVAIFRGIPGEVIGLKLNEVYELQDIQVTDLPKFYQEAVRKGITVSNLEAAQTTSAELRAKALHCIEVRKQRENPPTPTPSPTPSATPTNGTTPPTNIIDPSATPSVSESPTEPTATETWVPPSPYPTAPVDSEEC